MNIMKLRVVNIIGEKKETKIEDLKLDDKAKKFVEGCKENGGEVSVNGGIITCKIKTKEMDEPVDLVKVKEEEKSHTLMESNDK